MWGWSVLRHSLFSWDFYPDIPLQTWRLRVMTKPFRQLNTGPVICTFWWCKWDHLVREIPAALQQQVRLILKAKINRRPVLSRIKGFPAQFMIHHLDCFHLASFPVPRGHNIPSRESTHPPARSEQPPAVLFFHRGGRRDDDKASTKGSRATLPFFRQKQ